MMHTRRHFLGGSFALTALMLGGCARTGALAPRTQAIGLQLFTLRDLFAQDAHATLRHVAAIGYREVEFGGGGYEDMDHRALRRTMDEAGLAAPSIHLGYDLLRDEIERCITIAKTLGADTIVLPFMTEEHRTEQAWEAALQVMNRIARKLAAAGLAFAYHNHDYEFTVKPGGISLWDRFLRARDKDLVKIELDLFWVVNAGLDPKALIKAMPGAFYAYHVKDMGANGWMAAVGTGSIDFASIFALNHEAGVRHFIVENDIAPAPYWPDVTTSFANLQPLLRR